MFKSNFFKNGDLLMEQQLLRKGRRYSIIVLILSFLFYSFDFFFRISQSIVVPQLGAQYHVGVIGIAAFASAFYLGYALLQIPSGFMLNKYRINRLMGIFTLICSICYLFFLYGTSFWLGYLLRLMIGATSAISFIGLLYIARVYIRSRYFSFLAGLAISIGTLSASFVQSIGAFFIRMFNWHYALAFPGVIACLVGLLFFLFSIPHAHRGKAPTWASTKRKIQDLSWHRILIWNAIIGGLFYLPTTILASLWGVPFMITHYSVNSVTATTAIMFLFLGWAIGSPIIAVTANFCKKQYQVIIFSAACALIISLLFIYLENISKEILFSIMFFFGLASSGQVLVWKIFDLNCPHNKSGVGIALTNMIIMIFGSLFHLIVGFLMDSRMNGIDLEKIAYQKGLLVIPILFFVVIFLAFLLKKNQNSSP